MELRPNTWFSQSFRLIAIIVILTAWWPIHAAEHTQITSQIYTLLEAKNFDEAFTLANKEQAEYEGVADFDLAYGLAAQASGHCHLGLYSLERVVQLQPQTVLGRFALANCYFALNNYGAADTEFQLLETMDISLALRQSVAQVRAFIKRQLKMSQGGWFNSVQVKGGTDSNPNNGVEDEFISVPMLGEIRLFAQSREASSGFYDLSAQFSYFKPVTQQTMWYASVGVNRTEFFDDLALSQGNLNLLAGYGTSMQKVDLDFRAFYRPLSLDGNNFLNYLGVSGQASLPILKQGKLGTLLTLAKLDYADLDELNRDQTWLEVWFEMPSLGGTSRFTLKAGNEQASSSAYDFNSRTLKGLAYGFSQQFNQQWFYSLSAEYLKASYGQSHPLFMQVRDDKLLKLGLKVNYQWRPDWRVKGQIGLVDNSSNIPIYQYDRSSLWLGAEYQF